ncbi:unnamed protein product, partial [Mesorhabditis belari]|uniref:Peptidase M14 carboxypeptidase A domain-containing protein n=1 Tax=Mesorhabditis belari TaxID=2138241 RepID=A0AAF3J791_9BILA
MRFELFPLFLGSIHLIKSLPVVDDALRQKREKERNEAIYAQFESIFPALPPKNVPLQPGDYYSLRQIENFMYQLAETHANTTVITVGRSEQNREILGVQLGIDETKPYVVIDAGIHAREWSAIHVGYYLIERYSKLLESKDAMISRFLSHFNLVIVPVLNPDGYIYTRDEVTEPFKHRLWRKNRSTMRCFSRIRCCEGVDLNRNWDLAFTAKTDGVEDPCSDVYPGPKPFSEAETRTYSEWLRSLPKLEAYFTLHSHGQLWLYPYAYAKETYPKSIERAVYVSEKVVEAIYRYNGTRYYHGSPADMLYTSPGSSMDWVQRELNPKFAFTIEVRPLTKEYGFILEKSLLIPASEEIFIGINVVLEESIRFRQFPYQFTGTTQRPRPRVEMLEQKDPVDPSDEKFDEAWMKWIDS